MMMKRLTLAILTLTLLLTSCAQPGAPATPTEVAMQPTATIEPTPTAKPESEPVPRFERAACPFVVPQGQTVECGFVTVPEDHSDATGPTIRIAVAIFQDQSDEHQSDPVMLLTGGPGEKTMGNAPAVAQMLAPIYAKRDFIVFDQRGAGLSEPALECPEYVLALFDLLDERDLNVALPSSFNALMACRDRLVSEGHNLSAYNTVQSAADVNAIRIALGYDQINLWGGSYGSLLAQAVMRDYPQRIRSAVIESVWPLEISFSVDTAETVPEAILRLLDACPADESCSNAYPRLREVLFEIIDRLNAEPVPIRVTNPLDGQSHDAVLTGDGVLANLKLVLYQTPTMPTVPQAIYDVYNGDFSLMTQLSSLRTAYFDAISRGMQYSVMCADDLIGRTPDEILDIHAALPSQLVGIVDRDTAVKYGIFGVCEAWPVEEADPSVKEPLHSDIPTLVLSGEFDPVTPPQFGRLVAGYLSNSYFFELPGVGHSGDSTHPCALSITAAFIDDPDAAPDGSCIAEMPGLAFALPVEATDVVLEAFSSEELGIQGLVPTGWKELNPGLFARGVSALDVAVVQVGIETVDPETMLDLVAKSYGLEEKPASTGGRQVNDFAWVLYSFEVQGGPRDLALAGSDGSTLFVLMRSASDERDSLVEAVFLPIVDALAPLR
jgi:pimeloyl-ACP methyl ester carboxylesterase